MASRHHRDARYVKMSPIIRAAAYADPDHPCWRCGQTLDEHAPHADGTPASWHCGHVIDGDRGSPLRAEASTCNLAAAARQVNRRRSTGYAWP